MIRKLYRLTLLVCYLIGVHLITIGQTVVKNNPYNQVSIASPTAASLGKYGDIPINYHTGIPQINIPIYTVKYGSLSLPISLSYHASGLKSQEPSSWVGAGWALNAGGVVTRSVVGGPDERNTNGGFNEEAGYYTQYGLNNYLYINGTMDYSKFADGYKDGEPDLFFFNFGEYSGKFYFNDDHTPMLVPESDIKISPYFPTPTGSGISSNIQGFIITIPNGEKYYFGNTAGVSGTAPIEITNSVTNLNGLESGAVISSWYLNKIVSADDLFTINLNYTAENYGYFNIAMMPINPLKSSTDAYQEANNYTYDLVKNIMQGVRLSSITFPNGVVNFNPVSTPRTDLSDISSLISTDNTNTSAKALSSIQISDQTGFCKNFNFTYGYFNDVTTPMPGYFANPGLNYNLQTDRQRLKLDQVQEQSCSGVSIPPHSFTYYPEQVPRRISFGIDHWGFINGQLSNSDLVPTYTVLNNSSAIQYSGANREANWPAMRAGSLQKITYPTSGNTEFYFEPNDTYINTTTSGFNSIAYMAVGYDGSITPSSQTFSYNNYNNSFPAQITLNNSAGLFDARLEIKNSGNTVVYVVEAYPGQTNQVTFPLSDGIYTGVLSFLNYGQPNSSGHGCNANFSQWQTVTTPGNVIVGGLRIKSISNNDNLTSNSVVTSYNYLSGSQSTGVLYSKPSYIGIIRNDQLAKIGYYQPGNGFEPLMGSTNGCPTFPDASYYISSATLHPMATTQGSHLGYNQVKVSQSGNGNTIYQYYGPNAYQPPPTNVSIRSVNIAGCDGNQPNYPTRPLPFNFMRSELKYQAVYHENGQPLKEVSYFPIYQNNPVTTPGFIVKTANGHLLGTFYDLNTAYKTQMKTDEIIYTPGIGNIKTVKTDYYQSTFHRQVTSSQTTTPEGNSLITNLKYANDFRIPSCDAIADGWQTYLNNNNSCQAQLTSALNSCNGSNNVSLCKSNAYLDYQQCLTNSRNTYVTYRRAYFTDPGNTFTQNHNAAKQNADAELKPILQLQDEFKNPVIETSSFKNNNLTGASFNRFDYGMNSSAFVYPNRLQAIFPASLSTAFTNASSSSGSSVTKDSRYKDEAFYKFNGGNAAEFTGKDGLITSYIWGYNNSLPIVKAVGVDVATLNAAYNAVAGNLTQLRNQSSLSNALINTYSYSPLVGIISETDPSGKTISYEYDPLGRLSVARDQFGKIIKKYEYKYVGQ